MSEEKDPLNLEEVIRLAAPLAASLHEIVVAFRAENQDAPDIDDVCRAVARAMIEGLADALVAQVMVCDVAPEWALGQAVTGVSLVFCNKLAEIGEKDEETIQ